MTCEGKCHTVLGLQCYGLPVAYSSEPANANANAIMAEQTGAAPPKAATSPVDNSLVACCLPDGWQRENGQNSW